MRLKRLELQGFKSFLDRTILNFEPGVTGVVGPNGCGKSNIVDAIMWVMGEQSPKHLRGDSMTDVIFNGSDHKAPTSMAEVSLILDRGDVPLAAQFAAFDKSDEISITRRIYRDGQGEFLINKTQCRLKDIHELFMDTGVGRRAYSIIEQGQIDRMINTKPEERRLLFEEVAGITKYKAKRKEAERKLEQTRLNMTRLQDILTELEKQIRSLKVQATRARKYRELKVELEAIDLFLLGRDLEKFTKSISQMQERREELIRTRAKSDATFGSIDAEYTQLDILRIDQEKALQSLSQKERDLALAIQKLESQVALFDQRREYLSQAAEAAVQEEKEIEATLAQLQDEGREEEAALEQLAQSLQAMEDEIVTLESQIRQFQDHKFRINQKRDSLTGKKNQLAQKQVSLGNQTQYAQSKEQECLERQSEVHEKLAEVAARKDAQLGQVEDVDGKITDCAKRTEEAKGEVSSLSAECQNITRQLTESENAIFATREEFHNHRSRLQSLKELQENLEGYSPTAREVLQKLGEEQVAAIPLAEVLQPSREIEDHLEVLLGAEMNTLVVKTTAEAERVACLIQEQGLERVKILAISELADVKPGERIAGCTPVLDQIKVTAGYEPVVQWYLGKTYLVSDRSALFSLRLQHRDATFYALDTKTAGFDDRSLASGSNPTKVGVFARRREIDELTESSSALDQKLAEMTAAREQLLQHLQSQEELQAKLKDGLAALHIESVELRKEREKIQLELSRTERDAVALNNDAQRNETQLLQVREQIAAAAEELQTVAEEMETIVQELDEVQQSIENAAREFEEQQTILNEKKIERSRLGEKRHSLEYKVEQIADQCEQLQKRQENLRDQRLREEKELENIDFSANDVRRQREQSIVDRNQAQVDLSDMKNAFNDTSSNLAALRDRRSELQKSREDVISEINTLELRLQQETGQVDHIKSLCLERYQREATPLDESATLDISQLPLLTEQMDGHWDTMSEGDRLILLQEHLKAMRDKVGRYGEVNLTAIHEFDEVQKRYEFLMEQKTDLENSIKILEEAIIKIDESTKSRFEETFEAVNRKFKEIFPILFNGGKAELALIQAENAMDAGVDIMVHPPGKRPASITLLSGGEKALTAVSLVLAIFARKPSPFCLLDEVDAPLDDANVSRFNTVVRKMAEKTQFIVITHNKKTMEIAEALYGVTMERPGISKMTSVRLN